MMEYFVPDTKEDACSLLYKYKDSSLPIAGGSFFMAHRDDLFTEIEAIIDLIKLGLNYIRMNDDGLAIGATTTLINLTTSEFTSRGIFGVISETVNKITPNEIRNMGTVGGDLCISGEMDMPTTLIALNAKVVIVSTTGSRVLPLDELYLGYLRNALKSDEIITEIKVPSFPPNTGAGFYKYGRTRIDFPIVNAAARITLDYEDKCSDVKVVLGSIGETPVRANIAEKMLLNNKLDEEFIMKVAIEAADEIECITDLHATGELRQRVIKVALKSVLNKAYKRAKEGR